VRQEVSAHEIAKRPTTFIKEDTWQVVKVRENSERLWVVDPLGSLSLIQEESRLLISQGGDFSISGSGSSKDLESSAAGIAKLHITKS
jgi:hypothetical protein